VPYFQYIRTIRAIRDSPALYTASVNNRREKLLNVLLRNPGCTDAAAQPPFRCDTNITRGIIHNCCELRPRGVQTFHATLRIERQRNLRRLMTTSIVLLRWLPQLAQYKNSSGDEIANVNLYSVGYAWKVREFAEITQNNGNYAVQDHSRSPILVPIESSYTICY